MSEIDTKSESRKQKLPSVMTEEEFSELLKHTKQPHHRLAFKLAFLCGLRISEIVNLKPFDLDFGRKLIKVREGKWHKDRYVPLPKFLKKPEIDKYIPIKCGVRALEIAFKKTLKKALNRDDLHFHNLRHSFATNLLNKGIPITDIQFWLGHSRLQTTSIYLKVSPNQALQRYEEMWE